ncbi:MAG: DNA topoisomerase 3 [Muribaculaceae bacterium]|nr:DNA topoisomerase 3 [Muribaculaceae bacterium]
MKLCITEKPSVAKDIAAILGANVKRDGYYEGGDYKVTWTYGHLCTLKEPHDYCDYWKRWTLVHLPMIPPRFGIKLIDDEGYIRQFHVIESLIAEADEVINCGDAGQEGELIQRWVMQKAKVSCPVKRLWISSLTDESIRDGFRHLEPESKFDNLYYAGLSRSIGDWILGMNATRLYSLKYSSPGNVLSIGRVQTPTLALIVNRHHEIANFVPQDSWELRTIYREALFTAVGDRFSDETAAAEAAEKISAELFTVDSVSQKKGREAPPRLFDLTSLQVECNKRWGWSADESLRLIQSLYEKKVTTYPRVDTTYLSDDIYPKIPDILRRMTPYADITAPVLAARIPKSKKVFDNSKVTDHHAIIPTGQSPAVLAGEEKRLYHLIARRFIAAFYPDCEFNTTTVLGHAGDVKFKASGKVIVKAGWRDVYAGQSAAEADSDKTDEGNGILPAFTEGESGSHKPLVAKRTTQPPKYYTEGTLLRAMETAGKTVDDETLREAMKENGIGRPSTRAAIIETLFRRRYIYRKGKSIMASDAGIQLIATIKEELLKSARLTGEWESKLRRIERGDYKASDFIGELKEMIGKVVINVLSDNSSMRIEVDQKSEAASTAKKAGEKSEKEAKPKAKRAPRITKLEQVACPLCGQGHILKGRTAYGCSRFREGCTFRIDFTDAPETLTPSQLAKRLKK